MLQIYVSYKSNLNCILPIILELLCMQFLWPHKDCLVTLQDYLKWNNEHKKGFKIWLVKVPKIYTPFINVFKYLPKNIDLD